MFAKLETAIGMLSWALPCAVLAELSSRYLRIVNDNGASNPLVSQSEWLVLPCFIASAVAMWAMADVFRLRTAKRWVGWLGIAGSVLLLLRALGTDWNVAASVVSSDYAYPGQHSFFFAQWIVNAVGAITVGVVAAWSVPCRSVVATTLTRLAHVGWARFVGVVPVVIAAAIVAMYLGSWLGGDLAYEWRSTIGYDETPTLLQLILWFSWACGALWQLLTFCLVLLCWGGVLVSRMELRSLREAAAGRRPAA